MLIYSVSNINRALKMRSLIIFEKYSRQLVLFLNVLWKKKLITGYTIKSIGIKIYLKYNRGVPVLKQLLIESKPSRLKTKKLKEKFSFSVLSNSYLNFCVSDLNNEKTQYGIFFFKVVV